jgi:hypothetical protein
MCVDKEAIQFVRVAISALPDKSFLSSISKVDFARKRIYIKSEHWSFLVMKITENKVKSIKYVLNTVKKVFLDRLSLVSATQLKDWFSGKIKSSIFVFKDIIRWIRSFDLQQLISQRAKLRNDRNTRNNVNKAFGYFNQVKSFLNESSLSTEQVKEVSPSLIPIATDLEDSDDDNISIAESQSTCPSQTPTVENQDNSDGESISSQFDFDESTPVSGIDWPILKEAIESTMSFPNDYVRSQVLRYGERLASNPYRSYPLDVWLGETGEELVRLLRLKDYTPTQIKECIVPPPTFAAKSSLSNRLTELGATNELDKLSNELFGSAPGHFKSPLSK